VALGDEAQARALAQSPEVAYVVEDGMASTTAGQLGATWGLDRLDQRESMAFDATYTYDATGNGVNVYIIDSGIRTSHPDFEGRATRDFTAVNDGWGADDCDGHGTHVAGTVGGATWGVAKKARLHSVRVFDCNGEGSWSQVIAGVDWVTGNHIKPAVANMSLSGGGNQAADDAVQRSIARGVVYAVAAGNDSMDACGRSPARTPNALTVGATASDDWMASFSNFGGCVDLFAPGVGITSASLNGGVTEMSGTSMAAPHVAGVAALFLQNNPMASASQVAELVRGYTTPDVVKGLGAGSPNRLLYSRLPMATRRQELYRYYNSSTGDHFYTSNWYELGGGGGNWTYEGLTGFVVAGPVAGTAPFYRYYNKRTGDHFYTPSWSELGGGGGDWVYEGVTGYVPTASAWDTYPLYRYYNTGNGDHFYTTNWNDLGGGGGNWVYEGLRNYIYRWWQ
jgi:subtilisin family serine protease